MPTCPLRCCAALIYTAIRQEAHEESSFIKHKIEQFIDCNPDCAWYIKPTSTEGLTQEGRCAIHYLPLMNSDGRVAV